MHTVQLCLLQRISDLSSYNLAKVIWFCLKICCTTDFKAFKVVHKQCMQRGLQLLSLTFPYLKANGESQRALFVSKGLKVHLQGYEDLYMNGQSFKGVRIYL